MTAADLKNKMKICVITPRWSIAGVALAQRRFAMALAARGHDVDFIVGYQEPGLTVPDTPGPNIILWNAPSVRQMVLPFVRYLKVTKPDVVFSAEDHLNGAVLLAAIIARSPAKISGSSRVPPSDSYSNRPLSKGWFRKMAMRAVMHRADALTCVSKDMVNAYRTYFPDGPHRAVYNIIADATSLARAAEPVDHEWFVRHDVPLVVSAGTLTGRKNYKMLINAVAELKKRGTFVRLAIFGEGYRRTELEALVASHSIEDRTWMPGRKTNPLAYFSHADVIALSSYAEGLPNVLIEGMVCGCTPVATNCPTGPREVIEGSRVGHLVAMDDVPAMADAIQAALARPATQRELEQATAPFREDVVIGRHFALLGLPV